jgi:hypothetical protein
MGNYPKNSRIIEAGHFYEVKGPTAWSRVGWRILSRIKKPDDKTMLFVDDVHQLSDVHESERNLPNVSFPEVPKQDFLIRESFVKEHALEALDFLKKLPKRKKARFNGGQEKRWFCSGVALTHSNEYPTCTLLDLGLTIHKHELGFKNAVNILPLFYEEQQAGLLRLVKKCLPPDFNVTVILFDSNGNYGLL